MKFLLSDPADLLRIHKLIEPVQNMVEIISFEFLDPIFKDILV